MAKVNVPRKAARTHEGAPACYPGAREALRRSVLACMLWESTFYEDGEEIAARIRRLVGEVEPEFARDLALRARTEMKLRHVPLWLAVAMASHPNHRQLVAGVLESVVQRPDELAEVLALYWKDGRRPLSAQIKKGLAKAFAKFNEYSLAKYNRKGAIKLRDVLRICHPKPKDAEQAGLWKRLIKDELEVPDTWETALSARADKKETWTRLLSEGKLGTLALLRNLRNMQAAQVAKEVIIEGLRNMKVDRVLPFRFIAAARYAPHLEPYLESAMLQSLEGLPRLKGRTVLLVDVSGSMDAAIGGRSEMTRLDAACGLAVLARELCEDVEIYSFSERLVQIPLRRGFALRDAVTGSQYHSSTYLGAAVAAINKAHPESRLVVFTDEESHDPVPAPKGKGYMINVASSQNGVGYGQWTHVTGFSEAVFNFICESENEETI